MSAGVISGIFVIVLMIFFIGIWVWAWNPRNKKMFDDLADLPLRENKPKEEPNSKSANENEKVGHHE